MKFPRIIHLFIVCSIVGFACGKDVQPEGKQPSGPYLWDYKVWSAADSVSVAMDSSSFFRQPISFVFIDSLSNPMRLEVESGLFYIHPRYELSFENNGADPYNLLAVSLNDDDVALMAGAGLNVIDGPNILMADPINQTFEFQYTIQYDSSEFQYIVDKYYR